MLEVPRPPSLVFAFAVCACAGAGPAAAVATAPPLEVAVAPAASAPPSVDEEASAPEGPPVVTAAPSAPEIQGKHVAGSGPWTLAGARGRVVLVDFWATFCAPCKRSFPAWQSLADKFGGDLVVIGVSVDEAGDVRPADLRQFAADTGARFAIAWDDKHRTAEAFGLATLPSAYLIDKVGRIRSSHRGYQPGDELRLGEEIQDLLKE